MAIVRAETLAAAPGLPYSRSRASSCDSTLVAMQLGQIPWLNRVVVCREM